MKREFPLGPPFFSFGIRTRQEDMAVGAMEAKKQAMTHTHIKTQACTTYGGTIRVEYSVMSGHPCTIHKTGHAAKEKNPVPAWQYGLFFIFCPL